MLTRKNGHFAERFPWPEKVEDLFLALSGKLEYFDPAGNHHIEPISVLPFREDGLSSSEYLIRYDHGEVFELGRRKTLEEGNAGYAIQNRQGLIPLSSWMIRGKVGSVNAHKKTTPDKQQATGIQDPSFRFIPGA
jgi:hypothetical protein